VIVSPDYFPVMEIQPVRGRVFSDVDGVTGSPVVIVNESFAKMSWPGQDPLGKRLRLLARTSGASAGTAAGPQPWLTVVGIIHNIVQSDNSQGARDPLLYLPYRQLPTREMVIVARTLVPPGNLGETFRREVQALDSDLPVTDLRTLDALLWERTWTWRVYGSMFSIFAAIALLLAAVGLYAVIAHGVNQRTQEIGIRIAMGASKSNILRMVFAQGASQLLIGLAVGVAASVAVTQVLGSLLIGVKPADPVTLVAVAIVLSAAGVLGCGIPARRATKVDPIVALRYE
jgi:putative ABC transport system permease protein